MDEMAYVYIYDGSFTGLLTAIYDAWYDSAARKRQTIININTELDCMPNFLDEYINVSTEEEKASKVYNEIKKKISKGSLDKIYTAYLSCNLKKGTVIYNYLRLGFKLGPRVDEYIINSAVMAIDDINRKFGRETNKLMGFIRFKMLESNILFSEITPENNQMEVLAPFFMDRMPGQRWIIYDKNRNISCVSDGYRWLITNDLIIDKDRIDKDEIYFQEMWQSYFKNIAIESRRNYKLQRQFVPIKYRKNMIEFSNNL
ncbi:MAG: TIGR03915 family putative DNA repair protein [Clostridiales bacterium]|jgi:probable DNA metabolism protein|nr:TIGR03915 family putative DNA repair protein [Clostridiales bacterium]